MADPTTLDGLFDDESKQIDIAKSLADDLLVHVQSIDHKDMPEIAYMALKLAYHQYRMFLVENFGADYIAQADSFFCFDSATSKPGTA